MGDELLVVRDAERSECSLKAATIVIREWGGCVEVGFACILCISIIWSRPYSAVRNSDILDKVRCNGTPNVELMSRDISQYFEGIFDRNKEHAQYAMSIRLLSCVSSWIQYLHYIYDFAFLCSINYGFV